MKDVEFTEDRLFAAVEGIDRAKGELAALRQAIYEKRTDGMDTFDGLMSQQGVLEAKLDRIIRDLSDIKDRVREAAR